MCGCPVICFDKNAVSELITHKKNGYILKDKNLGDYKNFIKWICKNPNHFNRKSIALNAKKNFHLKQSQRNILSYMVQNKKITILTVTKNAEINIEKSINSFFSHKIMIIKN